MKTMKCECGKIIEYNYHYECFDCTCGKTYNAVGQELRPVQDWKEEFDEEDY